MSKAIIGNTYTTQRDITGIGQNGQITVSKRVAMELEKISESTMTFRFGGRYLPLTVTREVGMEIVAEVGGLSAYFAGAK